jgi:hypothetical protein
MKSGISNASVATIDYQGVETVLWYLPIVKGDAGFY